MRRAPCLVSRVNTLKQLPSASSVVLCRSPRRPNSPRPSPLLLLPVAGSGSSMQFQAVIGRSIFTTAAALASAYYAVAFGRTTACDAPGSQSVHTSPKFSAGRARNTNSSTQARRGGATGSVPEYSTMVTGTAPPPTPLTGKTLITSVVAFKGQRSYMEDDFFISKDGCFAAVYDGHGGAAVSKYLRQNLHAQFLAALPDEDHSQVTPEQVIDALSKAFKAVDDAVCKIRHWSYMGSTAVALVVHWDKEYRSAQLITANVGDSRAVLSRRGHAVDLTQDHKPNLPSELDRVKKLGGTVRWYGLLEQDGKPMEGMGVYRINGNLAVARAIGDRSERPFVSGEADLASLSMEEGDQFIILASDGLWDVMTSEEAVAFVHNVMSAHVGALREGGNGTVDASERPVDLSTSDWTAKIADDRGIIRAAMMARKKKMARYLSEEAFRRGTTDNVTVQIIWLQ